MKQGSNANINPRTARLVEFLLANAVILAAFAIRVWALDAKGLAYDETATALMSRASIQEIISFHWDAAFEHLPLWIILMRWWSQAADQSEFALRIVPALAGVLTIPIIWALQKKSRLSDLSWRFLTALLMSLSPILIFYSQEARMYSVVVLLGVTTIFILLAYLNSPRWYLLAIFVVVNWAMLGMQYYSLLLLMALGLFCFTLLFLPASSAAYRKQSVFSIGALALSVLPLAAWMALSPGFHATLQAVINAPATKPISLTAFGVDLWIDLSFGAIRWQPEHARVGFLMLPILLIGVFGAFWKHGDKENAASPIYTLWPLSFALITFVPVIVSSIAFRTLAARYILYIMPFAYAFITYAVIWLWRRNRILGIVAGTITLVVALTGLGYYFGPYAKSEYRDMAQYVQQRLDPDNDSILLESPRQHLMAKYYFGQDYPFQPIPAVEMPAYWPLNAPQVVPEEVDDVVQQHLSRSDTVWLILSAESEVDRGEFLGKYLTAVSYKDDCKQWLDVRLCKFTSPKAVDYELISEPQATFGQELLLSAIHLGLPDDATTASEIPLRLKFDWFAQQAPSLDYTVSVKVSDQDGQIVAQADQFPIGTLLPPTTWAAGDEKPGYVVVELPAGIAEGKYKITADIYDPNSMLPVAYTTQAGDDSVTPIDLGTLEIGDTMRLMRLP